MSSEQIRIPCEVIITPGGQSRQNRICIKASGETVFDDYEQSLDKGHAALIKCIVSAHARLLHKWAQS